MARVEFLAKWRAIASLDLPYGVPVFNNDRSGTVSANS